MRFLPSLIFFATITFVVSQMPQVIIQGHKYTPDTIKNNIFPEGVYIVGCRSKDSTNALLAQMPEIIPGYVPTQTYSSMPMFAGRLNHEQILKLLESPHVEFIEADSLVHAFVAKDE